MASVDVFEMALVHRMFRKEFRGLVDLIGSVEAGDTQRSRLVGRHAEFMLAGLHHHHAAEDELMWPKLHARVPIDAAQIQRMQDQHARIAASVDTLRQALPTWVATADPQSVVPVTTAAVELSNLVDDHLTDEEENVVPLIAEHVSASEWQEVLDRGASFLSATNIKYGLVLGRPGA